MQAKSLAHTQTRPVLTSREVITGNEEGLNGSEMRKQRTQLKRTLRGLHSHMV